MLDNLFSDWSASANPSTLNHLFEIIESHESEQIRELALLCISRHFPRDKIKVLIDFWITHPLPQFHKLLDEIIGEGQLAPELLSVVYLMRDDLDKLFRHDPDFKHIDAYLNTLDPLLGSLVFRRYSSLRKSEIGKPITRDHSLVDLIRLGEYQQLWDTILEYPFPFICDLLRIFNEEGWKPIDSSDLQVFDELTEFIGNKGWKHIENVLYFVVSRKSPEGFQSLSNAQIRERDFHLRISPDIIQRPDRILKNEFISRGNRSLADPDLGIELYEEGIRKSDVDGLLHIPIYALNGTELAEFSIPASGPNSFIMDDDGLYFTIKQKNKTYSVDLDSLAALLLPISRHSSAVSDIIDDLLVKATGRSQMILRGLDLLSTMHRGREFTLFDTKIDEEIQDEPENLKDCSCAIGVDVGDAFTKAQLIPGGSCNHTTENWVFPSMMYYKSPLEKIIGADVIEEGHVNSTQTFKYFKTRLKQPIKYTLRIHTEEIIAEDAFLDFIEIIIKKTQHEVDYPIHRVAITYSLNLPNGFDMRIRQYFKEKFAVVEVIDELTATITKHYRVDNMTGNLLFLDLGSSQMSGAIAHLPEKKSRKRSEETLIREKPREPPRVISRKNIPLGLRDMYQQLSEESGIVLYSLDQIIKDAFNGFQDQITVDTVDRIFKMSGLFDSFTYLIRDLLAIAAHRGVRKNKISKIVLNGNPIRLPSILKYAESVFQDMERIEGGQHDAALGAGLICNGQSFISTADRDYFCRVSDTGITNYVKIIRRGEKVSNKRKFLEIQQKAWFDRIVLDLWSRKQKVFEDDNVIPLKDTEMLEIQQINRFDQFFLSRELLPIGEELIVEFLHGLLRLGIKSKDEIKYTDTDIQIL